MNYLEWLGYIASFIILISLLMSSIIKLRWINLLGSIAFGIYGFLIGSLPVAVMNIGIVLINAYYLYKIYGSKEYFQLIEISKDSNYFKAFIKFYQTDILKFFGKTDFEMNPQKLGLYILRDMVPAGIFIASKINETTLEIEIDYAVAAYRDFKLGHYLYEIKKSMFLNLGYTTLTAKAHNDAHKSYLEKMGFLLTNGNHYEKHLK